jgi:hypothetical protein
VFRIALATLLLLAGQAKAVDYVKCEAMNLTFARLDTQQRNAMREAMDAAERREGLKGMERINHPLVNAAALKAAKPYEQRMEKIIADYKKAGCP